PPRASPFGRILPSQIAVRGPAAESCARGRARRAVALGVCRSASFSLLGFEGDPTKQAGACTPAIPPPLRQRAGSDHGLRWGGPLEAPGAGALLQSWLSFQPAALRQRHAHRDRRADTVDTLACPAHADRIGPDDLVAHAVVVDVEPGAGRKLTAELL